MKLIVTSFLFLQISQLAFSQLLRRDVYDFEVGDYYSISHYWHTSSNLNVTTQYDLFQISGKIYNSDSTIVNYTANTQIYVPPLPGSPNSSLTNGTISFLHSNLGNDYSIWDNDDPFGISLNVLLLADPDPDSCVINELSYTINACLNLPLNRFNFGISITDSPTCFEPITSSYFVQEGCGGPYGGWAHYGDPSAAYGGINLVYFKKGNVECGQFPAFFVGLPESTESNILVYPNPIKDHVVIQNDQLISQVEITDLKGNKIALFSPSSSELKIDLSHFSSGWYLLKIMTESTISYKRIEKI